MELTIIEKMIPKKFVVTEFGEIALSEIWDVIEDLEGTGWAGPRIVIYDHRLKNWLVSLNVINDTSKGSVYLASDEKLKEVNILVRNLEKEFKQN